jgi:tetratricopeptide (TPR) repeat protein
MGPDRRHSTLATVALIALVLMTFGRVASHEFVNLDDDKFIYANPALLPPTFASLSQIWRTSHASLYVPVPMSAWWLVAQAGLIRNADGGGYALNPWLFHAASVLVHVVNALLARRILRTLTRNDLAAVMGAAVFAIHPLQAETVAWASELKDLLAAMFALCAIAAALHATAADDLRRRPARWGIAAACFVLALLSKPSAVTIPIIVAALLWTAGARPHAIGATLLAGVVLAIPVILITRTVQPALDVPAPAAWQRPIVAADAVAFYLGKTAAPARLAVDYGRTPAAVFASHAAYWTWLIPAAVTVAVVLSRRRTLIAAWVIFLAGPAANLGLLPFDFQLVSTVADHYVYLGLLGVALPVAWLVTERPAATPIVVALVFVLAVTSFVQARRWRDSYALWRHAIDVNPRSGLAHGNLGVAYLADNMPADAIAPLERAAELEPHDPFPHLNLIRAYLATGDTQRAADAAERLVAAYRRRADFNPTLIAAVLDRFADAIAARGDSAAAQRLRDEAARLRKT